jgi:hypothetical protein
MAINLLSPIARMSFGPERGTLIWQLPINTVSWLKKQNLTEDAKETLEAAWDMFLHEGQYAVLKRDPAKLGKVSLVLITEDYSVAKLAIFGSDEFVYHITSKIIYEKAS